MTISLTAEQQAWLHAQIARGEFASVDEAVRQLLDERIAERTVEASDDMAWAKPFVDEALAEVDAGQVLTREEHESRMDAVMAAASGLLSLSQCAWLDAVASRPSRLRRSLREP